MSAGKHTPGPWHTGECDGYKLVFGKTGINVCRLSDSLDGTKCGDANLHLIAAAPDMLAALEGIVAGCVNPDQAIRRVMIDLEPIRAAIAAAKGEKGTK